MMRIELFNSMKFYINKCQTQIIYHKTLQEDHIFDFVLKMNLDIYLFTLPFFPPAFLCGGYPLGLEKKREENHFNNKWA